MVKKEGHIPVAKLASIFMLLVMAVVLGLALENYQHIARLALAFPYPIDYGEGPLLDQSVRLARGENIYHNDFSKPPFTISNYPPLFPVIQAPLVKIFGPSMLYGRVISLLCAVLTALFVGLTLYTLTQDWIAATVSGGLLLAYPYIQFWSLLNRIDLLALALSWAAIFVITRWWEKRWGILLGGLLFVASIYTRQSYALAGPAAVFFWLLVLRRPRQAFALAGLVGGMSLALFLLLNGLTRGGFALNIITANVNPFYWDNVWRNFREFTSNTIILLLVTAIFLAVERFGMHSRTWSLVLPYALAAGAGAVTIGKDGSNINYMLELVAAVCLGAGACLAWLARKGIWRSWLKVVLLAALAFQVSIFTGWAHRNYNYRITEKTDQQAQIARLADFVSSTDNILLADEYMGLLPLAGKPLYFQPFEFKMLSEGGVWEQAPFVDSIKNKQFSAILLYDPGTWPAVNSRWTPQMRSAIRIGYLPNKLFADTTILLPR